MKIHGYRFGLRTSSSAVRVEYSKRPIGALGLLFYRRSRASASGLDPEILHVVVLTAFLQKRLI